MISQQSNKYIDTHIINNNEHINKYTDIMKSKDTSQQYSKYHVLKIQQKSIINNNHSCFSMFVMISICIMIIGLYLLSIVLSLLLHYIHSSDILLVYLQQSIISAILKYKWMVLIWIIVIFMYMFMSCCINNNINIEDGSNNENRNHNNNNNISSIEYNQSNNNNYNISNNHVMINKQHNISQTKTQNINKKYKHRLVQVFIKYYHIICSILMLITVIHCIIILNSIISQHGKLYDKFLYGTQHGQHRSTYLDVSWPGWKYYYSDNYYGQTIKKIQQNRAHLIQLQQYQDILVHLKNLHNGIYSMRSWLINQRMFYTFTYIAYRSVAIWITLFYLFLSVCSTVVSINKRKMSRCLSCSNTLVVLMLMLCIVPLFYCSMFVNSISMLNNHPICITKPNSGVVSLIIDSNSASYIGNLHLNVIEDPNNIYSNICYNMQLFYTQSKQNIYTYNVYVLNMSIITIITAICVDIVTRLLIHHYHHLHKNNSNNTGNNTIINDNSIVNKDIKQNSMKINNYINIRNKNYYLDVRQSQNSSQQSQQQQQ